MLAKMWKKILLAICIIACIFNVMSKLINRTSLEVNLKSVVNGDSLFSIFREKEEQSDTIEGVTEPDAIQNTEEQEIVSEEQELPSEENVIPNNEPTTDFVVIY